ncbi:hypothetical protein GCM10023116_48370 [Kistimonas scapharcae]|uniref:Large polyvalent protein associated domain-containing protein n=1 Tax=Kistimonas scapharcae TaxID=1036133 RepID=A0ABP8VAG3_9GAMM
MTDINDLRLGPRGGDLSSSDYTQNLDVSNVFRDSRFLDDVRNFYREEKGEEFTSDQDMLKRWYEDRLWAETNTVSAARNWYAAETASKDQRARRRRLQTVYNRMPSFWEEGGAIDRFGAGHVFGEAALSMLADPVNLLGGTAAVKAGGLATAKGMSKGAATWAAVKAGAKQEALVNAGISGGVDAMIQKRDQELGLQDEFSYGQLAGAATIGGGAGGIMGALMGAVASRTGIQIGEEAAKKLVDAGYTPKQIEEMPDSTLKELISFRPRVKEVAWDRITDGEASAAERDIDSINAQLNDEIPDEPDVLPHRMELENQYAALREEYRKALANGDEEMASELMLRQRAQVSLITERKNLDNLSDQLKTSSDKGDNENVKKILTAQDEAIARATKYKQHIDNENWSFFKPEKEEAKNKTTKAETTTEQPATDTAPKADADGEPNVSPEPDPEPTPSSTDDPAPVDTTKPEVKTQSAPKADIKKDAGGGTSPYPKWVDDDIIRMLGDELSVTPEQIAKSKQPGRLMSRLMKKRGITPPKGTAAEDLAKAAKLPKDVLDQWREVYEGMELERAFDLAGMKGSKEQKALRRAAYREIYENRGLGDWADELVIISRWPDMPQGPGKNPVRVKTKGRGKLNPDEPIYRKSATEYHDQHQRELDNPRNAQGIIKPGKKLGGEVNGEGYVVTRDTAGTDEPTLRLEEIRIAGQHAIKTGSIANGSRFKEGRFEEEFFSAIPKKPVKLGTKTLKETKDGRKVFTDEWSKRGERVYYDPTTDKVYATIGDARSARRGGVSHETPIYNKGEQSSAPKQEAGPSQESLDQLVEEWKQEKSQVRRGNLSEDEFDDLWGRNNRGKTFDYEAYAARQKKLSGKFDEPEPVSESVSATKSDADLMVDAAKAFAAGDKDAIARAVRDIESRKLQQTASQAAEDKARTAKAITKTGNQAGYDVPPGRRLAIRPRSGKPDTIAFQARVLSDKQLNDPDGVKALLGKGKAEEFEIGHVEEGSRSFSKRAGNTFEPLNSEKTKAMRNKAQAEKASRPEAINREPMSRRESVNQSIRIDTLTQKEIDALDYGGMPIAGHNQFSISSLDVLITSLEPAQGLTRRSQITEHIEHLRTLYDLLNRHAPNGIMKDVGNRADIEKNIDKIFREYSDKEKDLAYQLLNRIEKAHGVLPDIRPGENRLEPFDNTVNVDPFNDDLNYAPQMNVLFHEVGHWAYLNLLTSADKLEFWNVMSRMYDNNGTIDINKMVDMIPAGDAIRKGVFGNDTVKTNDFLNRATSPQEIFAQQFDMWVNRKLADVSPENEKILKQLWSKITNYIKAIFDRYWRKQPIDPNLEPIFAKILPDDADIKARSGGPVHELSKAPDPTTVIGAHIHKTLTRLDEAELAAQDLIAMAETGNIHPEAGMDLATTLFSLQRFGPIKSARLTPVVRRASNQLFYALKGEGSLSEHITVSAKETDDEAMSRLHESGLLSFDDDGKASLNGSIINFGDANPDDIRTLMYEGRGDAPPILEVIDRVRKALQNSYREAEDIRLADDLNTRKRWKDYGNRIDATPEEKAARKQAKAEDAEKKKSRRKTMSANRKINNALAEVKDVPKPKRQRGGRTLGKIKSAIKIESKEELEELVLKWEGTELADGVALELLKKIKASPLRPEKYRKVRKEVRQGRIDALAELFNQAIKDADSGLIDEILWTMQYRAGKNDPDFDVKLLPSEWPVLRAVERDIQWNTGHPWDDGVPPEAPMSIRTLASYITHRNPELQDVARTLATRAMSLIGKDSPDLGDIYRLTGKPINPVKQGAIMDFTDEGFKTLRSDLRRLSNGLTKAGTSSEDVTRSLARLAMRAALDDSARYRVDDFSSEKFLDAVLDHLGEKKSLDTLFDTGDDQLDSFLVSQVEKIREAAAYLSNGLIGRDDIKRQFRPLTLYGDMFARSGSDRARYDETPDVTLDDWNLNGGIMESILDKDGPLQPLNFPSIGDALEKAGAPKRLTQVLGDIIKQRPLNENGVEAIAEFHAMSYKGYTPKGLNTFGFQLRSNSRRLRDVGMKWFADFLAPEHGTGHFERVNSVLSAKVQPIIDALHKLPDAGNALHRYARGVNVKKQPDSFQRIVDAMRVDPDSKAGQRAVAKLKGQEKGVYEMLRDAFAYEKDLLKDIGIPLGDIKGYFPQIWRGDMITKHYDEFVSELARYFRTEHELTPEFGPITPEEAITKAKEVAMRLTEEDGVYSPPIGASSRESRSDHLDYARMLRLEKHPEFLKQSSLGKYMEQDLESVLVKYFDSSTRRFDLYNKYGEGNHAFYEYMDIMRGGVKEAVGLLTSNKVRRYGQRELKDGHVEDSTKSVKIMSTPFTNDYSAQQALKQVISVMQRDGKEAGREFLKGLSKTPDNPHWNRRVNAVIEGLADSHYGQTRVHDKDIKHAIGTFNATQHKPISQDSPFFEAQQSFSSWVRAFNSVTLLGFVTLTSTSDLALPLVRSGNFRSYMQAVKKMSSDPDYRDAIRNIGVAVESMTHQRMQQLYGNDGGKISTAFFNAVGLTQWTDSMRKLSGAVGMETFKAEIQKARKHINPKGFRKDGSIDWALQPKQFKSAHNYLKDFGLEQFVFNKAKVDDSLMKQSSVREAVIKFANETIFTPNQNDIPLWAQTPIGRVLYQFKSFPTMMMRMVKKAIMQAKNDGNPWPLLYLIAATPAVGAGSLALKDLAQMRGGDDGRSAEFRERSFNKLAEELGYDPVFHGKDVDKFFGWYAEGLLQAGALGLIADTIHNVAAQNDNGAYGRMRQFSALFGPTFGLSVDAFNIAEGLGDDNEDSNAKERTAARSLATRIPVLGGIRSIREGAVDEIAGEKKERGSRFDWD